MITDCRYSFLETSIVYIKKPELAQKGDNSKSLMNSEAKILLKNIFGSPW